MIKFCHIAPHIVSGDAIASSGIHLTLAHLVEQDTTGYYCQQFNGDDKDIILDNSAFEMYKAGKPMYNPDQLIEMGERINADYIVMSDYPNEPGQKTIDAAERLGPQFKEAGFKTFFVPQSRIGDKEDYIQTFKWALDQSWIDLIGVSILGVPNAYGVEKDNKLQRYLSRYVMMRELFERGILIADYQGDSKYDKRLHMLGMTDGPNEITLMEDHLYDRFINSWDSSAAVWAGMNGILFDDSPTGLINGKFEDEVDFDYDKVDESTLRYVFHNMNYINKLANQP